jgi:cyclopentanol dehydrogenase
MARLENKVAIITGVAGGLGEAEARLFAVKDAKVLLTDIHELQLKAVAEQIVAQDHAAAFIVQDVASESGWQKVIDKAIALFGKIDVLVNNAGITGNLLVSFEERTLNEFTRVISVNLVSQFLGTKAVMPYLRENGGGSIINISSIGESSD